MTLGGMTLKGEEKHLKKCANDMCILSFWGDINTILRSHLSGCISNVEINNAELFMLRLVILALSFYLICDLMY